MFDLPPERRADLKRMGAAFALVATTSLMLFTYLWRNVQMSNLRYEISRMKKERRALYLDVEKLRIAVAKHTTASRIDEVIRQQQGYLEVRLSAKITSLKLPRVEVEEDK